MISYERLVVPRDHLDLLVEPGPRQIHAALSAPPAAGLEHALLLDRPLSEWRRQLRERLGLAGPLIVTGHQAEFAHAGVFAKTIAAHALAMRTGGTPVFLTVDSDLPKTQRLIVPQITSGGLRRVEVAIPGCDPQRTVEYQPAAPRQDWLDFFVRIASIYEHYDVSLLRPFADAWLDCPRPEIDYCDALARGWSALEEALGLPGVRRLRMSKLCATPEFRAFAAHLILHASRLADAYNAAQAAYRQRHRLRSTNRPVAPLAMVAARTEVPLWVSRADGPRQRLYVADHGQRVELYAGPERIAAAPKALLADPQRLAEAWSLEPAGWHLRPRAVTLSAFARLFLADLFVHGIGGAKYEEVTDECLRRFFELQPPPICCVSATAHLPLPRTGVRAEDVRGARRESRDLRFNPQRHLDDVPADLLRRRAEMVRRSDQLRAQQSKDRAARRMVFDEIRLLNEQILARDPWRVARVDQHIHALEQRYELDRIAQQREYFAALHLKTTLAELAARLRDHLHAN